MKRCTRTLLSLAWSLRRAPACMPSCPQLQWAHAFTSSATTFSVSVNQLAVDNQRNLYVAGGFSGTVDFDPGSGTANLTADTAFGLGTNFLAKYDAAGVLIYVRQLSTTVRGMVLDKNGDICVTGAFTGTKDFDPGAGTAGLRSAGGSDIYIAKYNAAGAYINAFRIGSTLSDGANAIAADGSGNLYITGYFEGTVDFDAGAGMTNLSTGSGGQDIFLAKYSGAGALQYAFRLSASGASASLNDDEGSAVVADNAGNVFLGGRFFGVLDMDPGPGTASYPNYGGLDGFVAKYGPTGDYIKGFTYHGNVYTMAKDGSGNIYVYGSIPDTMDVDPGPGTANLYSKNNFDVWYAKYDAGFNYLHAYAFVSNSVYTATTMAVDYKDRPYFAGRFNDTVDFNPGGSGGSLISKGGLDGYLVKADAGGAFLYGASFGSTGADNVNVVAADGQGGLWIVGTFTGTIDMDPGPGVTNLTSTNTSLYLARYTDDAPAGVVQATGQSPLKIYGSDQSVIVDFTGADKVDAGIKILDMQGRTIAWAKHDRTDRLSIPLPCAVPQLYLVVVSNGGRTATEKVWVR